MKKFICIIMLLFVKTVCFDKSPVYAYKTDKSSIQNSSDIFLESSEALSKESSDQAPQSQRKKRIKGISFEFLFEISDKKSERRVSREEQLLTYFPVISTYHYFCNGKRGPPYAMSAV